MKNVHLVFGGTGYIGSAIVRNLVALEEHVMVMSSGQSDLSLLPEEEQGRLWWFQMCDVTNDWDVEQIFDECLNRANWNIASVVYCVGNCPPDGFADAVKTPLLDIHQSTLEHWFQLLPLGLARVVRCALPQMSAGSSIIVIGSASTRFLSDEKMREVPTDMHLTYYAGAMAALDAYVLGIRCTPGLLVPVHLIKPAAVDTPFHRENTDVQKIPVSTIVATVKTLMGDATSKTVNIVPE